MFWSLGALYSTGQIRLVRSSQMSAKLLTGSKCCLLLHGAQMLFEMLKLENHQKAYMP
jgi:hypothetical protein